VVFVFTFLGEFGYELLNWQGVIRQFAAALSPSDALVCCSRGNVRALYERADLYIDIADAPLFRRSRACCYGATIGVGAPRRLFNRAFDTALRASLRAFITKRIHQIRPDWRGSGDRQLVFIFSSNRTDIRGTTFGCDPERIEHEADIGMQLDVKGNCYERIRPELDARADMERRLGFDLSEPYILLQARSRRVGPQTAAVPMNVVISALMERARVVLLSFETGRAFDSSSRFDASLRCIHAAAHDFPEQSCLIHFARHCVFFTEGDLGSHTFVPPLLGKNVTVVAPKTICTWWRDEIDLWNRKVFRFGGQLVPHDAEAVCASRDSVRDFVDQIMRRHNCS
jgi:hypothetical protein